MFNVQPQATERIVDLIDRNEATTQRLTFLRGLVPAVYTGMAYLALVGALAVVAAINSASLTSVGAVMLIMLRSLSYGQGTSDRRSPRSMPPCRSSARSTTNSPDTEAPGSSTTVNRSAQSAHSAWMTSRSNTPPTRRCSAT